MENFKSKKSTDNPTTKPKPQCIFTENTIKCENKPVPLSKFCLNRKFLCLNFFFIS